MKKEIHLIYRIDQDDDCEQLDKLTHNEDALKILANIKDRLNEFGTLNFKIWFEDKLDFYNIDL